MTVRLVQCRPIADALGGHARDDRSHHEGWYVGSKSERSVVPGWALTAWTPRWSLRPGNGSCAFGDSIASPRSLLPDPGIGTGVSASQRRGGA
jgi:hypothetical protein